MADLTPRAREWAATMAGHGDAESTFAHSDSDAALHFERPIGREMREEREDALLSRGATRAVGAGNRAREEEPDPERTCFERDRDRIVHSAAFRRLAGKTQVVVYPTDHQRTRLTHAIEVAQVATSIARGVGANVSLVDAMALGHDCGHGPGGHASEDALDPYLPEGYDHGPWGANVVLADLNLCAETLDGVRNHSWSRPAPQTVEGEIVSWADRIAYCAHDLEDAIHAGIVTAEDIPANVIDLAGRTRRSQLSCFVHAVIEHTFSTNRVGMAADIADALASLRAFNYDRIYTRPDSVAQAHAVIEVLRGLVDFYLEHPSQLPNEVVEKPDRTRATVAYVAGMTDRFAFDAATNLLGWRVEKLPRGIGHGA